MGLGTNIGDRPAHIRKAVAALSGVLEDMRMSGFYETAPRDYFDQPDFLNTAVCGRTRLSPTALLDIIHQIEHDGGRLREGSIPKGPRTIDIDILLYGDICETWRLQNGEILTIPHISMHERLFVLAPLAELMPQGRDPRDGVLWSRKASHLSGQRVKLYEA